MSKRSSSPSIKPRKCWRVKAEWDVEADVWVVTSDIPGLVFEAGNPQTATSILERLASMIPEMLELNDPEFAKGETIDYQLHWINKVRSPKQTRIEFRQITFCPHCKGPL